MKKLGVLLGVCLFSFALKAQNQEYCHLQGAVYETSTKQGSDFWVFVEESEAFADLLVYKEENKLYADEAGIWFFVESNGLADFTVFLTKKRIEADFIIYFTDTSSFAGCK